MDTHLKRLTLITNDELALLNGGGINDMDDLGYIKYADIQSLLIGSTTMTWRKIDRVVLFIDGGETVRTVITMADITANLQTGGVPSLTTSNATASTHAVDPNRVEPKLHVNALKEFDGQPINYKASFPVFVIDGLYIKLLECIDVKFGCSPARVHRVCACG